MAVKHTLQAVFVYGAMLAYLLAFAAFVLKARKAGWFFYVVGFVVALAGFVYRGIDVKHVPLQNLFEVFLCLGVLALPISILCRRLLKVGGEAGDVLIAFVVLFPAAFVFKAEPQMLPPALQSWLFAPHVMAYMLAYMIFAKAGVQAFWSLRHADGGAPGLIEPELGAYRVVLMGFPLLTLGLILGAWWGKIAWGDYWSWDPKELWSLITWLVYVGYLHFRYMHRARHPRINALLVLGGTAAIVLTLLWVNLAARFASGLHSYAN